MDTKIKITNATEQCVIDIEGVIGVSEESQFAHPSQRVATYERFREVVDEISAIEASEVVVNIRSAGGDVNDALLIYEALSALETKVVTRCYGYVASAATIIAQAASEGCREIASSALYLIHQSSCVVEGNASDVEERLNLLRKTDERISSLYAERSGREVAQFEQLMAENGGRGRWLSPEECVEMGLADVVVGREDSERRESIVDRVKRWFSPAKSEETEPTDINILHAPVDVVATSSVIAFEEGQKQASSSKVKPVEDPSVEEVRLSGNISAYDDDAKRLRLLSM